MEIFRTDDEVLKRRAVWALDPYFPVQLRDRPDPETLLLKMLRFADFIVAADGDEPVGLAAIYANDPETHAAYITMFGVKDEYGRRGIGRKLMDACRELALSRGMDRIRLEVLDSNERAIRFYTKNGFIRTGACREDSSYMEKVL